MKTLFKLFLVLGVVIVTSSIVSAQPKSGYEYLKPETQRLQDDDFENPGLLAVENGEFLFNQVDKTSGKSCTDCHGVSGEKLNVKRLARYPLVNEETHEIISLHTQVMQCRDRVSDQSLSRNHADLLALETFVRHLAQGQKVNVQTGDAAAPLIKKGEDLFKQRYGLIDISCEQCHGSYAGMMVRGQKISQGQGNGFPAYRLDIGEMTNMNQRITQCLTLMRAEPFADDSDEIRQLELYLMSRSNGLPIETPAVRY